MARRVYAPALTEKAFKQIRPGGRYANYLAHLAKNRRDWDPTRPYVKQYGKAPPRQPGKLPTYESLLRGMTFETPAQLEARANRMTQQQIAAQRGIIGDEYKQAQADALKRMQAFQAAGRAAAAMNASLIGQVGSQYQAGADQLSAMAAAGAGMMSGATGADVSAAQNALGAVGAPALSIGGPVGAPGIAGSTQAGVEEYRGGTLPAQQLTSAGGYAQAGAAGQIAAQNLRATQEAQAAYMSAMGEAQSARQAATKEILRGRPGMAAEYLLKLQDSQRQQMAIAMSLLEGRRGVTQEKFVRGVTKQEQARADRSLALQERQFNASKAQAEKAAALAGREIDEARSIATGWWIDKAGRFVTNDQGKRIKVPKQIQQSGGGQGGPSPQEIRNDILYEAQRLINNYTVERGRGAGTVRLSKQQLMNALLRVYPGYRQAVRAIVNNLYPKGNQGGGGRGGGQGTALPTEPP